MIRILFILLVLLAGCRITEDVKRSRAEKYYRDNPQEFAQQCARAFPPQDSTGEVVIGEIKPGNNDDYGEEIESITAQVKNLMQQVREDTAASALAYKAQITALDRQIKRLKDKYKPCVPDTVPQTQIVYRDKSSTLARIAAQQGQISDLEAQVKTISKSETEWKNKAKKRNWILIGIYSVAGLSFAGWLVSKFKTINLKK